ncbi:MAG TPA: hypothetical protein VIY29_01705 [Ktedonobacteraceae bacterium]
MTRSRILGQLETTGDAMLPVLSYLLLVEEWAQGEEQWASQAVAPQKETALPDDLVPLRAVANLRITSRLAPLCRRRFFHLRGELQAAGLAAALYPKMGKGRIGASVGESSLKVTASSR